MARLDMDTIKKVKKDRISVHTKVMTTYSVFGDGDNKYVQIDTYGKSDRAIPEKISQSIQFDRESALFLVKLLVKEFDLLPLKL